MYGSLLETFPSKLNDMFLEERAKYYKIQDAIAQQRREKRRENRLKKIIETRKATDNDTQLLTILAIFMPSVTVRELVESFQKD